MHLCLKVICQARDGHLELIVQDLQLLEYSLLVFVLSSQQDHQVKLLVCDIVDKPGCQSNPQQHTALGLE